MRCVLFGKECNVSKHSTMSAHLARLNICGWLANAFQFQETERVNMFDRYAREHHSLRVEQHSNLLPWTEKT